MKNRQQWKGLTWKLDCFTFMWPLDLWDRPLCLLQLGLTCFFLCSGKSILAAPTYKFQVQFRKYLQHIKPTLQNSKIRTLCYAKDTVKIMFYVVCNTFRYSFLLWEHTLASCRPSVWPSVHPSLSLWSQGSAAYLSTVCFNGIF